jgi:hypothetical protein
LLIASALVLIALALRSRPQLWETVTLVALAVLTIRTQRSGVWLLFFAGAPAATALHLSRAPRRRAALGAAVAAVLVVIGIARGPLSTGAGSVLLDQALRRAGGTPILADGVIAEQVAFSGGRIWMGNPLDAFHLRDQRTYLDWIDGRPAGALALARAPHVVLVSRHSHAMSLTARAPGFRAVASDSNAILYVRQP